MNANTDNYKSSQSIIEKTHDEYIDEMHFAIIGLTQIITGSSRNKILSFNDNFTLTSETRKFRFRFAKGLSEFDLKAIYSDSRKLAIILNDFLKQLDDELDSRKRKEALTSE
jgi:hypothetical protein